MSTISMEAGFEDPGHDAQTSFRALLGAMSQPGTIATMPFPLGRPSGLGPALTAALLTLADFDTPVWFDASLDTDNVSGFFAFHCGCKTPATPQEATFIVCRDPTNLPPFDELAQGTPDYPDRSATLLIDIDAFAPGGVAVELEGPGIEERRTVCVKTLDERFWTQAQQNHARYPLGIDIVLCAGKEIMALPRSTKIDILAPQQRT